MMAQFTQREFLFLDDLLHMEELAVKQASDLSQHCQDPELQRLCMNVASRSERHFRTLLAQVNQGQGQGSFHQSNPTYYSPSTSGFGFNQQ